ncbi:hypothetical protein D3C76_36960 [compost metagenome]
MIHIIDDIAIPDHLIDLALCEIDKGVVVGGELNGWADEHILPLAQAHLGLPELAICANHVHIGPAGLTPHDHLPHAYTSVLYLVDAVGELVVHLPEGQQYIQPKAGRLVIFPATLIHHVEQSPRDEMRISFVNNYELPPV